MSCDQSFLTKHQKYRRKKERKEKERRRKERKKGEKGCNAVPLVVLTVLWATAEGRKRKYSAGFKSYTGDWLKTGR